MEETKKTVIYSQLESGVPGGFVTHASQIEGLKESAVDERPIIEQFLALKQGWNWISFYVETDLISVQNALLEATNGEGTIIINTRDAVSQIDISSTYDATTGTWSGDLNHIDFTKMYLINVPMLTYVWILGKELNPEEIEIVLEPGWNCIPAPFHHDMNVRKALENLTPSVGDQIKGMTNDIHHYEESDGQAMWTGREFTMYRGIGYMYKNSSSKAKTLKYVLSETDTKIKRAVEECKAYVDEVASLTESNAKSYTDSKIQFYTESEFNLITPEEGVLYVIGEG